MYIGTCALRNKREPGRQRRKKYFLRCSLSLLDEALLTRGVLRAKNCMHQTAARTGFFSAPYSQKGSMERAFVLFQGPARCFSLLLVGTIKKIIPPGDLR
jgi:hypothetical protein